MSEPKANSEEENSETDSTMVLGRGGNEVEEHTTHLWFIWRPSALSKSLITILNWGGGGKWPTNEFTFQCYQVLKNCPTEVLVMYKVIIGLVSNKMCYKKRSWVFPKGLGWIQAGCVLWLKHFRWTPPASLHLNPCRSTHKRFLYRILLETRRMKSL